MAKSDNSVDKSWTGVGDARPCSSSNTKDNKGPRTVESVDWKGGDRGDSRPSSSSKSFTVKVGG